MSETMRLIYKEVFFCNKKVEFNLSIYRFAYGHEALMMYCVPPALQSRGAFRMKGIIKMLCLVCGPTLGCSMVSIERKRIRMSY